MPHEDWIGPDGKAWPSVTEILGAEPKPWLQRWLEKHPVWAPKKTRAANNLGTAFHAGAEALSRGKDWTPVTRRQYAMLERVEGWLKESGFKPLSTELHVVSRQHRYHGTFDAVGVIAKHGYALVIVDYKTSSGIYPGMEEQLAAYAQAFYEEFGLRIKHGIIVHVHKDKPYHKLTVKEYELGKRPLNKFLRKLRKLYEGQ